MIEEKEITAIGKFQKTHALKGELNAILDLDMDFISEGNALIVELDGIFVPFYASGVRPKGTSSFLIKLDGVDTERDARMFVNKTIFALKSELAPFLNMDEDELLESEDVIGFQILDSDSRRPIGIIEDIDATTSNVLFIARTPSGDKVFIPAVDEFINQIDDENKIIYMTLPEGLIDLN